MKQQENSEITFVKSAEMQTEVRSLSEKVGDKGTKLTTGAANVHSFDKMNAFVIDETLNFRKKCAKIEAVIALAFAGKDSKDIRRHARKEFSLNATTLSIALSVYSRTPSSAKFKTLQSAINDFRETFYGANFALRVLKAESVEDDIPKPSESATVGAHWLNIVGKLEKLTTEEAIVMVDEIAEMATAKVQDDAWHPVKEA
jgi:hypothetical protein